MNLVQSATATDRLRSTVALPLALAYLLLIFMLPPKALDPIRYALLVLSVSAAYLLIYFKEIWDRPPPAEALLLALLTVLYVSLSGLGLLNSGDRLYATSRVLPQAAGLVLMLMSVPVFMHASRKLFVPRVRIVPALILITGVTVSILTWQSGEGMLKENGLYGVMSPALVLQFAYFLLVTRIEGRIIRAVFLTLPLPFMLAASNLMIQIAMVLSVLLPQPRLLLQLLVPATGAAILLIAFPPDFIAEIFATDDNTLVRSRLWSEAIGQIIQHPIGVGFGQSSVTLDALKDPWIRHVFSQEANRSLEVTNHNSLLDITLRLGWFGLLLFVLLLRKVSLLTQDAEHQAKAVAALSAALLACAFNPVVESVRSTFFFAFALGFAASLGTGEDRRIRIAPVPPASRDRAFLSPAERRRARAATSLQAP